MPLGNSESADDVGEISYNIYLYLQCYSKSFKTLIIWILVTWFVVTNWVHTLLPYNSVYKSQNAYKGLINSFFGNSTSDDWCF